MPNSHREQALKYLLGDLTEQDAVEFERQCFLDDELFEETSALENELVDSFVHGELSQAERWKFENGYLISPARRANLEFSMSLAKSLSARHPGESPSQSPKKSILAFPWSRIPPPKSQAWTGWMMLAAVILMAAGLTWFVVANQRLRREIESMHAQQTKFADDAQKLRQQVNELNQQLARVQAPTADAVLELLPGVNRSAPSPKTLKISPGVANVKFFLHLENGPYHSYRASVHNAATKRIWQQQDLKSQSGKHGSRTVTFAIPASVLPNGDCLIRVDGIASNGRYEEVAYYWFRIAKP